MSKLELYRKILQELSHVAKCPLQVKQAIKIKR
jgi:hypothetical protein